MQPKKSARTPLGPITNEGQETLKSLFSSLFCFACITTIVIFVFEVTRRSNLSKFAQHSDQNVSKFTVIYKQKQEKIGINSFL